jgi:thiol-disulfide isomerase/thioredoxin
MKKKFLLGIILLFSVFALTGCKNDALKFKEDYESMNGKENAMGKVHRTINISEKNPYVYVTPKELIKKIENKETFYVYFGDELCPWCRSVIEMFIKIAKENKVKKVYYVKIWDEEGNEVIRDKYEYKDGELIKSFEGTTSYKKLLEYFDSVLSNYTLTDPNGKKNDMKEKRIFAPNFFYIKDGKVQKMTEGISEKQTDSRGELTKEILEDEEKIFKEFFK